MQNAHETILDPQPGKTPSRPSKTLANRVREALIALGGEAHRALVIEWVAKAMGHNDARQIPQDLQAAVISSFEANWKNERRRAAYGFHLPFGEGSHRWGVRRDELLA